MPRKPRYARIAITLPEETLQAADRRAADMERPRSWVIAEAIRAYTTTAPEPSGGGAALDEPLGRSRMAQLAADLRLSPLERVIAAEETARVTAFRRRGRVQRVIGFDRYEDYLEFKRRDAVDP